MKFYELETWGERTAVRNPVGLSLTYQELATLADQSVAAIARGSLVAIECENTLECLTAYLGCLRNSIVPLLVDAGLDQRLRERLLETYQVAWIWRSAAVSFSGENEADANAGGNTVENADGNKGENKGENKDGWHKTSSQSPALHPDLALLLSTSGSTGSPRLVRLSLTNLEANARSIAQYLQLTETDRPLAHLPISYSFGLSIINSHLSVGARLLLAPHGLTERGFWDFFKTQNATSLSGVPATFEQLDRLRFERMPLPSLKTMTQAGGRLAPDLVAKFAQAMQARGGKFYVMYGQTEATARIAYLPAEETLKRPESIGLAIPGGRLFLRDVGQQEILAANEVGEIGYVGPNVMLGYAESVEDLQLGDEQQAVLLTGDLGYRDEAGFYYVTGRLKRFIKLFGNRIGLDQVESALKQDGWDVAVMGDDQRLCVAWRGEPESEQVIRIKQQLVERFKLHHSVVRVMACKEFLMTGSQKPDYQRMLREWEFE